MARKATATSKAAPQPPGYVTRPPDRPKGCNSSPPGVCLGEGGAPIKSRGRGRPPGSKNKRKGTIRNAQTVAAEPGN